MIWRKIKAIKFFGIYKISQECEIALDGYEEFPNIIKILLQLCYERKKKKNLCTML